MSWSRRRGTTAAWRVVLLRLPGPPRLRSRPTSRVSSPCAAAAASAAASGSPRISCIKAFDFKRAGRRRPGRARPRPRESDVMLRNVVPGPSSLTRPPPACFSAPSLKSPCPLPLASTGGPLHERLWGQASDGGRRPLHERHAPRGRAQRRGRARPRAQRLRVAALQ